MEGGVAFGIAAYAARPIVIAAFVVPIVMILLSVGFGIWRPWLWIVGALLLATSCIVAVIIGFATE